MTKHTALSLSLLGLALSGSPAIAQLVPPIKKDAPIERPAPPPQVEAVPIPTPPEPRDPSAVAEPPHVDLKLVDITPRDEKGRVLPPPRPLDEMVIDAVLPQLSPEIQAGIAKARVSRLAGADRAIARKPVVALAVRGLMAELDATQDRERIMAIDKQVRELIITPALLNHLQNNVLISGKQINDLAAMLSAYYRAFQGSVNDNEQEVLRNVVRVNAVEPMQILDRLLLDSALRWNDVKAKVKLTEEQAKAIADAEATVLNASDDAARRDAMAALLAKLPEKTQTSVLIAVATPLPRPVPAKPAKPEEPKPDGK